ncbi:MAG: Trm112 family protein [Acidobacteria bacterium]|nr:Trm112 family protein [Acidobacteriota bacterium]
MAISQELLDILACPACKSEVQLTSDGKGLKCNSCYRVYPIRDDIPVMLIDEATIEPPPEKKE